MGHFHLTPRVGTSSGTRPASYPVGTKGSFLGVWAARAWGWPLTCIYCRGHEWVELCFHSPIRLQGVVLSWKKKAHGQLYLFGIALGYGPDDRGSRIQFPAGAENFSLHQRFRNGYGANPASYPMGTRGCFPGGKATGASSWTLTSI
jgi:hypothetical protein